MYLFPSSSNPQHNLLDVGFSFSNVSPFILGLLQVGIHLHYHPDLVCVHVQENPCESDLLKMYLELDSSMEQ